MIVVDGMIMYISVVGNPHCSTGRLWIPSPIGFIASECFYRIQQFQFLVFENVSMLERIEARPFSKTILRSVAISESVEVLSESCFLECELFSLLTIESGSKLSLSSITFGMMEPLITIPEIAIGNFDEPGPSPSKSSRESAKRHFLWA
jgi:hypothetical protein